MRTDPHVPHSILHPVTLTRPDPDFSEPAPPLWEQAAAVVIVVMLTGAIVGPVFAPTQEETPILRLVWLPIYAMIAGLALFRGDRIVKAWPALLMLGLLVLHCYASKYWSIEPGTTVRRTVAMAITSVFAIYLGVAFRGPHLPRLLMLSGLLMGIGSVLMVFAMPSIGIHQDANAGLWRGLWYEKNQMGLVMAAAATAAAACLACGDPRRMLPVATLVIAMGLVIMTQSKTSLLCLMLGTGLVGSFWILRQGGLALTVVAVWLGVIVLAAGTFFLITDSAVLLEALGKDPTLTGRTDIWAALMRQVALHPWTGFGYSAFWVRGSDPADFIRLETQWPVPSAHNGWIDLLVQLGWPGAILVGIVMAVAILGTAFRLNGSGPREGWFGMAYLAVFTLLSLSESVLLSHANLPWVLCLAILARAVSPGAVPAPVPLASRRNGAYQTQPRIASDYAHGPARRRSVLRVQ